VYYTTSLNNECAANKEVQEGSYWKLMELKAKLRAETWDDLIEKIYEIVIRREKSE